MLCAVRERIAGKLYWTQPTAAFGSAITDYMPLSLIDIGVDVGVRVKRSGDASRRNSVATSAKRDNLKAMLEQAQEQIDERDIVICHTG